MSDAPLRSSLTDLEGTCGERKCDGVFNHLGTKTSTQDTTATKAMKRKITSSKPTDVEIIEKLNFVTMKCSNTLTIEDPECFYMVSKASTELANQYHAQAEVRDQDNFNMFVYNDFTGYGLQEVIENQLTGINSCIIKRPEPRFVDLWIRLSAFAHWTADRNLAPWTMIDDSLRWNDTVAMIGYATIATLNALDRAGLLREDSPIKDLGFVLAILGDFLTDCFNLAGGIPWISKPCEACWPYKIVQYAKENGITINGVRDIEGRFVKKHDDEILAGWWKRKPCIDRWGWNTKWRYMLQNYGNDGPFIIRGKRRLGGDMFDITLMNVEEKNNYLLFRSG